MKKEIIEALKKSREALELDVKIDIYDCPHDPEQLCSCGKTSREMVAKYKKLRDEALALLRALGTKDGV